MARVLGTCIALGLLALLALPFARDAYLRFEVARKLEAIMDDRDRAAFRAWGGDAVSFGRSLHARCELVSGQGSAFCDRYRVAFE